jgi:hypothetical protein
MKIQGGAEGWRAGLRASVGVDGVGADGSRAVGSEAADGSPPRKISVFPCASVNFPTARAARPSSPVPSAAARLLGGSDFLRLLAAWGWPRLPPARAPSASA